MAKVYVHNTQVYTCLGDNMADFTNNLINGVLGIKSVRHPLFQEEPFYAAPIDDAQRSILAAKYSNSSSFFIDQVALQLLDQSKEQLPLPINDDKVIVLLSSTKGNVGHLAKYPAEVSLYHFGVFIQQHFQLAYTPKVYSTACISGTQALIQAKRYLEQERYEYAIVVGLDELTPFVYKGFQSFHAIENGYCKPFDKDRKGINLGEGGAAITLSIHPNPKYSSPILIAGGGLSNDANHLSGPSKTGEELAAAIQQALSEAQLPASEVQMISTHGTATIYNDEMESKALAVAKVTHAPVYSLKSYIGHTLGAAGVLETALGIELLIKQQKIKSNNFKQPGTPIPLNIITETTAYAHSNFLKTASGFGGCNAALLVKMDQ